MTECSYKLRIYIRNLRFSTVTPSRGHSFDPRQAVHLSVALFERGEMIQFCGLVSL